MSSPRAADEWDLIVPADGVELLAELRRHGIEPGQRVHLYAVPDASADAGPVAGIGPDAAEPDDLDSALRVAAASKRPPFRSARGRLAESVPAPDFEDFEEASRAAAADADSGSTLSE